MTKVTKKTEGLAGGNPALNRRGFIRKTAAAAAGVAALPLLPRATWAAGGGPQMAIVLDAADPITKQPTARWAAEQLRDALAAKGITAQIYDALEQASAGRECVFATGRTADAVKQVFDAGGNPVPNTPDALGLARGRINRRAVTLACGADARGLSYALLELADRVSLGADPAAVLRSVPTMVERPANRIRSVMRLFVSDVEDKPWYNDRAFWTDYLSMLAAQRFNRINLSMGLAYDFTTDILDCYFHFTYPFLVTVPGYNVRAVPLPDEERDSNLKMLQFISSEAARRGLQFYLGVWTHAYRWTNSPRANYTIEGLTDEQQGPYSRDAMRTLLEACPAITGVTLRTHGESGVPEGSREIWNMVFDGVAKCGRPVGIDLHAKGLDQETIDSAMATGQAVTVAPKFWAEHMGLPYMQAAIRTLELPPKTADGGFFGRSTGSRSFTRYGYADFMREGRKYSVLQRVWPGTQRMLLWGDPETASAYGRAAGFCGGDGLEIFDPLAFKGRKGSGWDTKGGRDGYLDTSLSTGGSGWQKYLYTYRLWGRLAYNPDAKPETWQRYLNKNLGAAAAPAEAALASSSRILPTITVAHCPSAANNNYWPEMYTDMIVAETTRANVYSAYSDTPSPKRFGTVSTLDPELFSGVDEFAEELLSGSQSRKYSPAEVARWLQDFSETSAKHLAVAEAKMSGPKNAEFERWRVDVKIQNGTGLFFAWKFRAGVLYALYQRSGHRTALEQALSAYRLARAAWADLAKTATGVYVPDVTYGVTKVSRGHWADRLPAIDADIEDMAQKLDQPPPPTPVEAKVVAAAMATVLSPPARLSVRVDHASPPAFKRGQAVKIEVAAKGKLNSMLLHYRRVNQVEPWQTLVMQGKSGRWTSTVPAAYTDSDFPLQYYFEVRNDRGEAALHPGLGVKLMCQPCFVVRQA